MCGIAGYLSLNDSVNLNVINKMTDALIHRGPDGRGVATFNDNLELSNLNLDDDKKVPPIIGYDGLLAFGHRRLSVIDPVPESNQPLSFMNGRYWIIFNGEIYNYLELREELQSQGYKFKTKSDTEVIMASYDYWGFECQNKFNGMWSFALLDISKKKLFLSRDRFGEKPFYFFKNENLFAFASEIKSLFTIDGVLPLISENDANIFLKSGPNEYSKETLFKNIYKILPGHFLDISLNKEDIKIEQKKYWKLDINHSKEKYNHLTAKRISKRYYELLKDSVRLRLRSDVPLGSALSGGLDSSSIVFLINEILRERGVSENQNTFSCVYEDADESYCDESKHINLVADFLNIKNYKITPKKKEIPKEHKKLIYHFDTPPENTCMSGWHTYKLVKRNNVIVTLDGQGADEQLTGYLYYFSYFLSDLRLTDLFRETYYALRVPGSFPYIWRGFLTNIFSKIFGRVVTKYLIEKIIKRPFPDSLNGVLDRDFKTGLVTLLHNADRGSMAHSVESRMPFLDFRLVEFLASVPSVYKIHNGWSKYIARLAFDKKLPDSINWRKDKQGWPIPEDAWFLGDLSSWLKNRITFLKDNSRFFNSTKDIAYSKENKRFVLRVLNLLTVLENTNAQIDDTN